MIDWGIYVYNFLIKTDQVWLVDVIIKSLMRNLIIDEFPFKDGTSYIHLWSGKC